MNLDIKTYYLLIDVGLAKAVPAQSLIAVHFVVQA